MYSIIACIPSSFVSVFLITIRRNPCGQKDWWQIMSSSDFLKCKHTGKREFLILRSFLQLTKKRLFTPIKKHSFSLTPGRSCKDNLRFKMVFRTSSSWGVVLPWGSLRVRQDNGAAVSSVLHGRLDSIWHCLPENNTPPKQPGSLRVSMCVCVLSTHYMCVYVCVCSGVTEGVCVCVVALSMCMFAGDGARTMAVYGWSGKTNCRKLYRKDTLGTSIFCSHGHEKLNRHHIWQNITMACEHTISSHLLESIWIQAASWTCLF